MEINNQDQIASNQNNEPAVKPSYTGGFPAGDLTAFGSLSPDHQALLLSFRSQWVEDPTKFRKLVEFLSEVPQDTAPDEKVRGLSFTDILSKPASANKTRIPITTFLEVVTDSRDRVIWLRKYLQQIFLTFTSSDYFIHGEGKEHDVKDVMDIYTALISIVEQAALQKLGAAPNSPVDSAIEERPFNWESYEVYQNNPINCQDIARLQEWVTTLQQMGNAQLKTLEGFQEAAAVRDELTTVLNEQIKLLKENGNIKDQIGQKQQVLIEQLRQRIPGEKTPEAKPSLDLALSVYTPYKGASEVQILTYALEEYLESRKDQSESEVKEGEFESAFAAATDAQTAQDILDDLRQSAVELAEHNFKAATYQGDLEAFRKAKVQGEQEREAYLSWFVASHSVGAVLPGDDEEETEAAEPLLDPEYYLDLTNTEKDVMSYLQAKGVPEHQLKQWAVNFLNNAGSSDHPEQKKAPSEA